MGRRHAGELPAMRQDQRTGHARVRINGKTYWLGHPGDRDWFHSWGQVRRHNACGNEFSMPLNNVIHGGSWCPPCSRRAAGISRRLTNRADEGTRAGTGGGRCLSDEYLGATVPLTWQHDSCGHVFKMTPAVVKHGGWCPPCRRKEASTKLRGTIAQMQAIARGRDGVCLSEEYLGNKVRLKWRHNACGREFEMTPSLVVNRGSWCPSCRKKEGAAKREASRRRKEITPKRATK